MSIFADRHQAGRVLATALGKYEGARDAIVLGLPRGGAVVAFEVARALSLPLDVFSVRKLGMPGHEELAIGAVAPGGVVVMNEYAHQLGIDQKTVDAIIDAESLELERRERVFRGGRAPIDVRGKTVILVDDGLATGATMRSAVAALRKMGPERLVVAVPVGSAETCSEFRLEADEVVCARTPEPFLGVGMWYEDFAQTRDDEVRRLLAAAWSSAAVEAGKRARRNGRAGALRSTVQKTHTWLHELMQEGEFASQAQAYSALRAVLHAVRDHLTVDEAAHLAAQLPMLVRGIYFEAWRPAATPHKGRRRGEFLDEVGRLLAGSAIDPEVACRAVFHLLNHRITSGEIDDVRQMLPEEVRDLWPVEAMR